MTTTQKKKDLVKWIRSQSSIPSRKEVSEAFPGTSMKHIRSALASVKQERE